MRASSAKLDALFEASKVRFILQTHGLKKAERRLQEAAANLGSEEGYASLKAFNEAFPTYPIVLGASRLDGIKVHADPRCLMGNLFKTFMDAPFVAAFQTFEAIVSRRDGRAVGVIFPRKGYRHGWIIHDELSGLGPHGTVLSHHEGSESKGRTLYVRSFQALVAGVWKRGHGWKP